MSESHFKEDQLKRKYKLDIEMIRDHLTTLEAKVTCTVRGEPELGSLLPVHSMKFTVPSYMLDKIFSLNLIKYFICLIPTS